LTIAPDPSVWTAACNNAWLQECPQPLTKQVWGNALHVSPADGKRLGLVDAMWFVLRSGALALRRPFWCAPANRERRRRHARYGRQSAGAIGNRVGFDVFGLRTLENSWLRTGAKLSKTGKSQNLLLAQKHFQLEGEAKELQPRVTLGELAAGKRPLTAPASTFRHSIHRTTTTVTRGQWSSTTRLHRLQRLRGGLPGGE